MVELDRFRTIFPKTKKLGIFPDEELNQLQGKIPNDLLEFLKSEQRCSYADNFLWTVLPSEYHEVLSNWGIDGNGAYVFLRTSFGGLIYILGDTCYGFNPHCGESMIIGGIGDFYYNFNLGLTHSHLLNTDLYFDLHKKIYNNHPELLEDEIYSFTPALGRGGTPDTARIDIVKMKEHLDVLSQLHDNRITEL